MVRVKFRYLVCILSMERLVKGSKILLPGCPENKVCSKQTIKKNLSHSLDNKATCGDTISEKNFDSEEDEINDSELITGDSINIDKGEENPEDAKIRKIFEKSSIKQEVNKQSLNLNDQNSERTHSSTIERGMMTAGCLAGILRASIRQLLGSVSGVGSQATRFRVMHWEPSSGLLLLRCAHHTPSAPRQLIAAVSLTQKFRYGRENRNGVIDVISVHGSLRCCQKFLHRFLSAQVYCSQTSFIGSIPRMPDWQAL